MCAQPETWVTRAEEIGGQIGEIGLESGDMGDTDRPGRYQVCPQDINLEGPSPGGPHSHSLFVLTVAAYLKGCHVDSKTAVSLNIVEDPKKDGHIVIVKNPGRSVAVNQPVFGLADSWGVRWGRIQEIRVNDVSVPSIEASDSVTEIGLRLDFKCTRGTKLYLPAAEDDAVWDSSAWSLL